MIHKLETGGFTLPSPDPENAPVNNLRPFDAKAEQRRQDARMAYLKKR